MAKAILLLFILFLMGASQASANDAYDVSCDNVARIRIFSHKSTSCEITSNGGQYHLLVLDLKPDAAVDFGKILRETPSILRRHNGVDYPVKDLLVTANNKTLRNDIPAITGTDEFGLTIMIYREEDAFDAARSVCPALVPRKVVVVGHKE